MGETYEVHCASCGKALWRTTWPTPTAVVSGCCLPKYDGPMPQPIPGGQDAEGNAAPLAHANYGGGSVEHDYDHATALGLLSPWKRVSCPWRSCDAVTFWRSATVRPTHCGRCGRGLERVCPVCLAQPSRVPDDYQHCGVALVSATPINHPAAIAA